MKIVLYGHPTLRKVSTEVTEINDEVKENLSQMVDKMREANGVGLAANQVDVDKRFFVLEIDGVVKKVINPEILENSEEEIVEELEEMWARAFQHELDHLDGILFVDRVSPLSKKLIAKKLETLKKNFLKGKIYREDVIE